MLLPSTITVSKTYKRPDMAFIGVELKVIRIFLTSRHNWQMTCLHWVFLDGWSAASRKLWCSAWSPHCDCWYSSDCLAVNSSSSRYYLHWRVLLLIDSSQSIVRIRINDVIWINRNWIAELISESSILSQTMSWDSVQPCGTLAILAMLHQKVIFASIGSFSNGSSMA